MVALPPLLRMTTLRVLLAAPLRADRADAWALFDARARACAPAATAPTRGRRARALEIVLAASQVRIASRRAAAAAAGARRRGGGLRARRSARGAAEAQHPRRVAAGAPTAACAWSSSRATLLAALAIDARPVLRRSRASIAEPDLAAPRSRMALVRAARTSARRLRPPRRRQRVSGRRAVRCDGALPPSSRSRSRRRGATARAAASPRRSTLRDADARALAARNRHRVRARRAVALARGAPRPRSPPQSICCRATSRRTGRDAASGAAARSSCRRSCSPRAALALHVVATVGEWASLRIDAWRRRARGPRSPQPPASRRTRPRRPRRRSGARAAATRNCATRTVCPRPTTRCRCSRAPRRRLRALPAGHGEERDYADGHWTLDLARADAGRHRAISTRGCAARASPALVATSATGARVRFGAP